MATRQPFPSPPTTCSARACAPSKKTSLNSLVPVICRIGRTSIRPGWSMGTSSKRQPVVPCGPRLGAGQHEAPVGLMGERGPDLLPGDPVRPVPRALRPRPHPGEIRPGAGLAVALAPQLVAARRPAAGTAAFCSALPCAIRVGASSFSPMCPDRAGSPGPRVLLGPDDLLGEAWRSGSRTRPHPTRARSTRRPRASAPRPAGPPHAGVRPQPRPHVHPKRLVLVAEPEVHADLPSSMQMNRGLSAARGAAPAFTGPRGLRGTARATTTAPAPANATGPPEL